MTEQTHVVSLGAGVQSTTMLLMAARGELEPTPDFAVFADTGWEPKAVYKHLEWLKGEVEKNGIKVYVSGKGNIRDDMIRAAQQGVRVDAMPLFVLKDDGDVGLIPRQCTKGYKVEIIQKEIRRILGYQPRQRIPAKSVVQWMGISTDEIMRVRDSTVRWSELRYPLIEQGMNRLDCMNWLRRNGYPIPPKSACIGCPYHDDRTWLEMKRNDPESWEDAVRFDKALREGTGLRGMKGQVFIHRSCVPLDEVELLEDQMDLFDDNFINECEGMCGV